MKCKLFVASIEPQALREEVEAILALQNRAARSDEKVLFKIILEKALEHERDFQRRKRQRESTRAGGKGENARESDRPKKKLSVKEAHVAKTGPPPMLRPEENLVSRLNQRNNGWCRVSRMVDA